MKIELDHVERLHLLAAIGALRASVAEIRNAWKLMDKLQLDEEEAKALGLRSIAIGGQELYVWEPDRSIPARAFELSEVEIELLKRAVTEFRWPAAVRPWLEPLLVKLSL